MRPREGSFVCMYDQCTRDVDCEEGGVCECGKGLGGTNVCLNDSGCQVNADCGVAGYCSPTFGDCGDYSGVIAYQCHTPQDECIDDADCGADENGWGSYCAYSPRSGRWQCEDSHCAG